MARKSKHKYPRRPMNDGDQWIDGYHHQKPRQSRGQPFLNIVRGTGNNRGINTGVDHVTRWKPISDDTLVELCLKGALTLAQLEAQLKRGGLHRDDFRSEFLDGLKDGTISGDIPNPVELFNIYRPALLVQ